uniref:Uncharacterized protein n=1 Tax=Anguilla anguilla TaxID=7936 RepID=A0A0E9SWG3_ANGAN
MSYFLFCIHAIDCYLLIDILSTLVTVVICGISLMVGIGFCDTVI